MPDLSLILVVFALVGADYVVVQAVINLSRPPPGSPPEWFVVGPSQRVYRLLLLMIILNSAVLVGVFGRFTNEYLLLFGLLAAFVLGGTDSRRERPLGGRSVSEGGRRKEEPGVSEARGGTSNPSER